MSSGSTNPLSKEYLDDASIGTALTEALTDVSNTEDSLEVENDLRKQLFEKPDAVIDEVMASATHVRDHKSVSADMLSKIWRIDREINLISLFELLKELWKLLHNELVEVMFHRCQLSY